MPIAAGGSRPALAAGNTVVLKPAERRRSRALRLARARPRGGHPRGRAPGPARRRRRSSGGASSRTSRCARSASPARATWASAVMAGCAEQVKRVTLELGGKSANVVFADADLERAAAAAPSAVFDNAGQDCCARSRLLVEASVYDRFMELLRARRQGCSGARPDRSSERDGTADLRGAPRRVASFVDDATVAFAGSAPERSGLLVRADGARADGPARAVRSARRSSGRWSR